jgi:fumarate reductase flavoprotein subunit
MSLGALCAAGTSEQKHNSIDDDAETFLADIMHKTGGTADPVIARTVAENSGPVLDWLASRHDVVFELDMGWRPAFGHTRQRLHAVTERTGHDMMARLLNACEHARIDIMTEAQVTDLFATPEGLVTGVRVKRPDGSLEEIGCKTLVLATSGFGGNRDMIARHIPDMQDARYFGWEANQGDAIVWGQALGGAVSDMDAYQGLGLLAEPQGIDVNPKLLIEGGFQINSDGVRFSHELDDVSGQGARVIRQPGGIGWVIYDQRIHEIAKGFPQYQALMALNAAKTADTAQELANLMGIDTDRFEQTLGAVRALQDAGGIDEFGRRFEAPSLGGPYYALKVTGALFHTQGGLEIDATARVRRADGSLLCNLFAGGGAARGISGKGPSGYLPGAGLCSAVTLGFVAGQSAARLAKAEGVGDLA